MPTLLRVDGFVFFFYANEHEPRHIHVMRGDEFAKIELDTLKVTKNYMKPKNLAKALELTARHRDYFIRRWNEWFNQS